MIDIRGDNQFIDVKHEQEWDSTLNNHQGGNKLVIDIKPGFELTEMKLQLDDMKIQLDAMTIQQDTEAALRKSNPALQDLYDKYQVVYTLVKKTDDAVGGIVNSG